MTPKKRIPMRWLKYAVLYGVPSAAVAAGCVLFATKNLDVGTLWSSLCTFLGPWLLGCVTITRSERVENRIMLEVVRDRLPYFTVRIDRDSDSDGDLKGTITNVTQNIASRAAIWDLSITDGSRSLWLRVSGDKHVWSGEAAHASSWGQELLMGGASSSFLLPSLPGLDPEECVFTMIVSGSDLHEDSYKYSVRSVVPGLGTNLDVQLLEYRSRTGGREPG